MKYLLNIILLLIVSISIAQQAPNNFTYTNCDKHSITLEWDSVSGVSEYEVIVNGVSNGIISGTQHNITGLKSNSNYTVEVRGKSASSWGNSSILPDIRTGTYPEMVKGFIDNGYNEIASEPVLNIEYTNQVGLKERRLTDRATMGGDTRNITKRYSKVPTFTSDSRIVTTSAQGGSANRNLFETDTWQPISNQILSTHMSYTDPKVSYFTTGNRLRKAVLDSQGNSTISDVYTFSDYDNCSGLPTEESKFSWDMRYVALELNKGMTGCDRTTASSYWAVVFDLETNQIVGEKEITYVGNGWVAVSPSGQYIAVLCSSSTPSPSFRVYKNDGTMDEMPYGDIQSQFGYTGHGDFQKSIQGRDVFVARVGGKLMMYILETGEIIDLIDDQNSTYFQIGHVGGQNILQPGWIFADERNADDYNDVTLYKSIYRKVFAIQLDENISGFNNSYVRIYARTQRKQRVGISIWACSDPTGQLVAFNNFASPGIDNFHMYVSYAEGWNLLKESAPLASNTNLLINEEPLEVSSYTSQDFGGTFEVLNGGSTLRLSGNSWKKTPFDYTVTPNTVLEFEFRVDGTGEIQGIGFDDNSTLTTAGTPDQLFFKLFGTQDVTWDNNDFENYSEGEGWKSYSISLGEYMTGDRNHIVFFGDKDSSPGSQISSFRNITLTEKNSTVCPDSPYEITASESDGANVPCNLVDDNLGTRWGANGDGEWVMFDLGSVQQVNQVQIAFLRGDSRTAYFDVQVSDDAVDWTDVYGSQRQSSGTTLQLQDFNFPLQSARYVRYLGYGNSVNSWNSLQEMRVNRTVESQEITLAPIHDAYLQGSTRYDNNLLRVNEGSRTAYLKYDLSSINGEVTDAELRFRVSTDTGSGTAEVYRGSDTGWMETNLSVSNRPTETALWGTTDDLRQTGSDVVVPLATGSSFGGGLLSLIVKHVGGDDFAFASKENATVPAPRLVLTYRPTASLKAKSVGTAVVGAEHIGLYPNPTTNVVKIQGMAGRKQVSVTDFSGRVLYSEVSSEPEPELNLSGYAPGSYFVRVVGEENDETFTVIKK